MVGDVSVVNWSNFCTNDGAKAIDADAVGALASTTGEDAWVLLGVKTLLIALANSVFLSGA